MIQFACDQCGAPIQAPAEHAGKHARCPKCRGITMIPGPPVSDVASPPDQGAPAHPGSRTKAEGGPGAIGQGPPVPVSGRICVIQVPCISPNIKYVTLASIAAWEIARTLEEKLKRASIFDAVMPASPAAPPVGALHHSVDITVTEAEPGSQALRFLFPLSLLGGASRVAARVRLVSAQQHVLGDRTFSRTMYVGVFGGSADSLVRVASKVVGARAAKYLLSALRRYPPSASPQDPASGAGQPGIPGSAAVGGPSQIPTAVSPSSAGETECVWNRVALYPGLASTIAYPTVVVPVLAFVSGIYATWSAGRPDSNVYSTGKAIWGIALGAILTLMSLAFWLLVVPSLYRK